MEKAKVYFTDFRTPYGGLSMPEKLKKLMRRAGIEKINFKNEFVAVKMHFGEPGNVSYLRPNYARAVADLVRELGGRPFLTDCNTLYVGRRKHGLEHLDTAYENGFNPFATGCHVVIADGLKGTDEAYVPVHNGELVKEAKIGRALMDADVVISLTHFKGHEMAGFGGALKNIGMGGGSRAGKMEMHCDGKPSVKQKKCIGCGRCVGICAHGAPSITDKKAFIDQSKCVGYGRCLGLCPMDAIATDYDASLDNMNKRMAEYTQAVCYGRPCFHVSLITDVSPYCDCHGENDAPVVADIGMLASFDPVALDQACADLVNAAPPVRDSVLGEHLAADPEGCRGHDHFHNVSPNSGWEMCLEHAEKIGLGTRQYELVRMK